VIEVRLPREVILASSTFDGAGICVIWTVEERLGVISMCTERLIGEASLMFGILINRHK
jgi:hypothetical protein